MTELETLFKEQFPEYCVGDKCLSPYFDLFEAGYEKAEEKLKCCQNCSHFIQDNDNQAHFYCSILCGIECAANKSYKFWEEKE